MYVLHFKEAKFEQVALSHSSSLYKDMLHLVQKHTCNRIGHFFAPKSGESKNYVLIAIVKHVRPLIKT